MFGLKAQSNFQLFQSYYVKGCLHKHNNSREPRQREAGEGKPALLCLLPACAWKQIYSHTESFVRSYDGKKENYRRRAGVCMRCCTQSPSLCPCLQAVTVCMRRNRCRLSMWKCTQIRAQHFSCRHTHAHTETFFHMHTCLHCRDAD